MDNRNSENGIKREEIMTSRKSEIVIDGRTRSSEKWTVDSQFIISRYVIHIKLYLGIDSQAISKESRHQVRELSLGTIIGSLVNNVRLSQVSDGDNCLL